MIEAANILYLVLRLIKIQVSWSVSWSVFELIEYVLIGMFTGYQSTCTWPNWCKLIGSSAHELLMSLRSINKVDFSEKLVDYFKGNLIAFLDDCVKWNNECFRGETNQQYLVQNNIWSWKSAILKSYCKVSLLQIRPMLVRHLFSLVLLFWKYWKTLWIWHSFDCGADGWEQMSSNVIYPEPKGTFMLVISFWRSSACRKI